MINNNQASMGISTDYGIATILGNFSEDFIEDTIKESINFRFRPYGLRSPNYPEIMSSQLQNVKAHTLGYEDQIDDKYVEVMTSIINTINEFYGLQIMEDIPDEQIYTIASIMYQVFVSEFTERMLNMYTQYIVNNITTLLNYLPADQKISKTNYAKKLYNDQNLIAVYDNMGAVVDVLAGLDFSFDQLIAYMSDNQTAAYVCQYINQVDDVYKNRFASFIIDPATRPDVITAIRFKFVALTVENSEIMDPITITEDPETED